MRYRTKAIGLLWACLFFIAACGGSGGSAPGPVNVNTLGGSTDVPVDSSFIYVASPPFDESTVTTSTYFINEGEECDEQLALDSSVRSSTNFMFELTPDGDLEEDTAYVICLTTDILYEDGTDFEGFTAQFRTAAGSAETVTVTLSPADGATDVALDAAVTAVFSGAIAEPSDWSAAFTLKKDDDGDSVCRQVTYDSSTLTATCTHADLDRESSYTSSVSGISDVSGVEIDAASATFTTKASVVISSTKLLRLDGTELDLTDQPIPRSAKIKYTLASALSEEADRDAFEAAITVTDTDGNQVAGTYEWASDYLSVAFTPSSKLAYQTEYTIAVDSSVLPVAGLSLSVSSQTFTTMTYRDIDGDGYADSIVGASGVNGGTAKGATYVFLGSSGGISDCDLSGTCSANITILGAAGNDRFGHSVSTGDVNADGYEDIIVGAYGVDNGAANGSAYVFLGSASGIPTAASIVSPGVDLMVSPPEGQECDLSGTCTPDGTILGAAALDSLGTSVSMAGDVNGDGYDDIIVGAYTVPGGVSNGAAYLFLGSADGISDCDLSGACTADATFAAAAADDNLGFSVSSAGDVNGDGYDDVIVAAYGVDNGAKNGAAYVFLGSANGISDCDLSGACTADTTILGAAAGNRLGISVSSAGDVNADGYDDIILGADSAGNGAAYLFLGSANGISDCDLSGVCTADATFSGAAAIDKLGSAVSSAGDVNGDGYVDFIIGTNQGRFGKGQAFLFLGSDNISDCDLSGACTADTTFTGVAFEDAFGVTLSNTGDVNADGYDDIVIGATNTDGGKGDAYYFLGSADGISDCDLSGACTADANIEAAAALDGLGKVK